MLLLLFHKTEEEIVSAAVAERNCELCAMQALDNVLYCCYGSQVWEQYQYYE